MLLALDKVDRLLFDDDVQLASAAAVLDGKLYVVGGAVAGDGELSSGER